MRTLMFSLILSVVAATFGLGWLIGQIYDHLDGPPEVPASLMAFRQVAIDLSDVIDHLPDQQSFINHWQSHAQISMSFQEASAFPVPAALQSAFYKREPLLLESDGVISVHVYMPRSGNVLSVDVPPMQNKRAGASTPLILTIGFYLSMVVIVAIWLYPLMKHLKSLRTAAKQFGTGDLSARVAIRRHSYIGDIEREFNAMAERIQQLISDNKILSRAVSHDLKTPLARLRFGLDTLAEEHIDERRQVYAARLNRDLDEMESLISTLLEYARLDEANIALQLVNIDLRDFMQQAIAQRQDERIVFLPPEKQPFVHVDRRYLSMQVNNVLDNALQYAKQSVEVTIVMEKQSITLSIEDDGEGIPENQRARLLQPFQRGEQKGQGHGMGLAISHKISLWFRGKLLLGSSTKLGGAKVDLIFPPSKADEY